MAIRDEKGRFVKGHAPISPGRPKLGYALADLLNKELDTPNPDNLNETNRMAIIRTLICNAKAGDISSIQMIFNRVYGKEIDILKIDTDEDLDLSNLTDEELALYNKILEKALNVVSEKD